MELPGGAFGAKFARGPLEPRLLEVIAIGLRGLGLRGLQEAARKVSGAFGAEAGAPVGEWLVAGSDVEDEKDRWRGPAILAARRAVPESASDDD
jgi:hypothetical protein